MHSFKVPSRWSVRGLLVWLVIACLLPGVVGATLLLFYQYKASLRVLERDRVQTARALSLAVDNELMRIRALAQGLATADSIARGDMATFHRRAKQAMAVAGMGGSAVLADRDARQILNTNRPFGESIGLHGNPELIRRVVETGQPAVSDLFQGKVLRRPVVAVGVPVFIGNGVAYVLTVSVLPEQFDAILRAQELTPGQIATVFDSRGIIVARTHDPERFVGKPSPGAFLERMKQSPEGVMDLVSKEGIPVRAAYSISPVSRWGVGIGTPKEMVNEHLRETLLVLAVVIASLFVLGLGVVRFMGGRIARSVAALTGAAEALGRGQAFAMPEVHVREADEVAAAMRHAAELLGERAATIEAKEAELQEAHRLARFGTWYWDLKTGTVSASDSIREMYGRDLGDFQGLCGTVLPVEAWERIRDAGEESRRTGRGYCLEHEVTHASGQRLWVLATCEAVRDEHGEVIGLRGALQDITERKEAEEKVRQLNANLERRVEERTAELLAANRELEAFTFATSHDLRGPLGRINSFSTLLEQRYRDRLDGEALLFLNFLRENASRLTFLIDDLLAHARVAQQKLDLQPIEIHEVVVALFHDKAADIDQAGAEIKLALPSVQVVADSHLLVQAVDNLLQNALKYRDPERGLVIEIGGRADGGRFVLWVRDNGLGFDMAYHDRIFEMFRRLHPYGEIQGSGIGLALVKRAMDRLGGRVWAESVPGEGACFFLEMQLAHPGLLPGDVR